MRAGRLCRWSSLLLLGIAATAAPDPSLAGLEGKLKKGVYVSPGKNFSVRVSKGTRAKDGYWRESRESFVEFVDRGGHLKAIWCTPFEPNQKMTEILADEERAARAFSNYFRDVVLPWIFHPLSARSTVLSSAVLSFDGAPAYYFLVRVPGASLIWDNRAGKWIDGRRATLGFNKCGYTYFVIYELMAGLGGASRDPLGEEITEAMIQQSMADGERALRRFLETVTFSGCAD